MNGKQNPHAFVEHIIQHAEQLLERGSFYKAFVDCLNSSNYSYCGWVGEPSRVFSNPQNDAECAMQERLKTIHQKVAKGLLDSTKPTASLLDRLDIEVAFVCIERLNYDVSRDIITRLRTLIDESKKLGGDPEWMSSVVLP